ncbi:MAG: hypothetical protein HYV97_04235 [Bdellovibrio sp.]|nr:hypothetical protein [Bdellovibrio sp.]
MEHDYRQLKGIHFLRLKGTHNQRARMHGELLKTAIQEGALPALAKKNEWIIRRAGGVFSWKPLQDAAVLFYHNLLIPLMAKSLLQRDRDLMLNLAEAAGIPYQTISRAMFQADGLMLLSRLSIMKYLFKDFPAQELPGCSSSVVHPKLTLAGKMLVSRNQDYPVTGPWERETTVIFHQPTEPGEIPHVSVVSAGLHTAGLTSMNQEGLTVAAHAHFGRDVSVRGMPVFVLGGLIASQAKNLNEAVDIVRKHNRYANWTFVVSSAKEQNAMAVEMGPKKMAIRYLEDGLLTHTNFFHTEMQQNEALICGGRYHDDQARICRMRQVLMANRGRITPATMSAMLGDHVDPWTGEERVLGNTLSVMATVKSVVFSPEEQILYVSTRGRSPMGLGDFMQIDAKSFWTDQTSEEAWPMIAGNSPKTPGFMAAVEAYREGYRIWHMESHTEDYAERALVCLRKAQALLPSDPHLSMQVGNVALKLGHFAEAIKHLEQAKKGKLAQYLAAVCDLFLARAWDATGDRDRALKLYQIWANYPDPRLREAMLEGVRRPYHKKQIGQIMLDMQFIDPIMY